MSEGELKRQKNLKYSMVDGVFTSLMNGLTVDYFTPFLLFLGGTVKHVGLLSGVTNLVSSIIQLKSADLEERFRSRKRFITVFVLLQSLLLIPLTATYALGVEVRVAVFIAMAALFVSLGAFVAPAWGSMMADIVEPGKRGDYFGWRGRILGFVTITAAALAGLVLHAAERYDVLIGFAALFGAAFLFRLVSWRYLKRMEEPPVERREDVRFSIFDFVKGMRESNFGRFVIFVSLMKFSVYVASPFFAVFMLRDLKFDYVTYTAITVASTIATNLAVRSWGRNADRAGNMKVVRITAKLVAFIPLLWLLWQNPYFLFFAQAFSGFAWAGFNLSASNFIYDACSPAKRTRCIAYFNFFNGVSLCIGSLLGAYLAQNLSSVLFEHAIMTVILVSALLRIMVAYAIPIRINEVRPVIEIPGRRLILSTLKESFVFVRGR